MDHKTKATIAGCMVIGGVVGLFTTAMSAFNTNPGYSVTILVSGACLFWGTMSTTAMKYEGGKETDEPNATESSGEE